MYGSLFLGVIKISFSSKILALSDSLLQVTSLTSNHKSFAYFDIIAACFHQDALKITTQSISFLDKAFLKSFSSLKTTSFHSYMIFAVFIAFHDHIITGFLKSNSGMKKSFCSINKSSAQSTISSKSNILFDDNSFSFSL